MGKARFSFGSYGARWELSVCVYIGSLCQRLCVLSVFNTGFSLLWTVLYGNDFAILDYLCEFIVPLHVFAC